MDESGDTLEKDLVTAIKINVSDIDVDLETSTSKTFENFECDQSDWETQEEIELTDFELDTYEDEESEDYNQQNLENEEVIEIKFIDDIYKEDEDDACILQLSAESCDGLLLDESDSVLNIAFSEDANSSCDLANITECTEPNDDTNLEMPEEINVKENEICETTDLLKGAPLADEDFTTQEPWPADVKLFQPYEVEQILLPDNANCLAVQAFLKMCHLDFQVEHRANAEAMSPSGKVPFIKAGAFVVAELQDIVQFAGRKGHTLTQHLDEDAKADMRAYMTLVHNVMEIVELYICWCDKETYNQVTSVRNGSIYPWPLNHIQNVTKKAAIGRKLRILGWHQKPIEVIFHEMKNCCQALSDRLDNEDYFFKKGPTELDALVFGHLFTILTTPLPNSDLAKIVRNFPTLVQLVQRIEGEYFKKELKQ